MKTGIVTFHGANNYGAVLQAYALTQWLAQNGIEAEIINYQNKAVINQYRIFPKIRKFLICGKIFYPCRENLQLMTKY